MATPYYLQAPEGDEAKPSFWQRLSSGIDRTPSDSFYSLASALVQPGPFGRNLTQGLVGFGKAFSEEKKRKGLAAAFDGLVADMPENMRPILEVARNDPEMQRALMGGMVSKMVGTDKEDSTSDIKNYEYAVNQGFKGTYFDFKNQLALSSAGITPISVPGVGTVNPKTGEIVPGSAPLPPPKANPPPQRPTAPSPSSSNAPKIPPGMEGFEPENHPDLYIAAPPPPPKREPILEPQAKMLNLSAPGQGQRWVWGDNAQPMLESVPGYKPQPSQIPAELSAKIGLAEGFLKNYQSIEKSLPELEAVSGRLQGAVNEGRAGEVRRQIRTGAEALVRVLTGAGKSESEARDTITQYMPSEFDTGWTLASKLRGLKYDLENTINRVMEPYGGWKSPAKSYNPGIPLPKSPVELKNDGKTIYQTKNGPAYYIGNGKFRSAE